MSNTKLVALMVLMIVLIAGAAIAGDMTVYGKLHLSTDFMNNSEDSQLRLSSNTSRFGLKGASEMNEDFTLIWQFENAINMAQKDFTFTGIANRNSYIGFKHEYGSILFGIHDTPFKTLGRKATFFFDELGDFRQATMGWDKRLEEIVMFTTKNYEGFTASAMYQFDQNALGELEAANTMSFNGMYKKDEFFIGAALEMMTIGNYGMAGDWDEDAATADTWADGAYFDDEDVLIGTPYVPEAPMGLRFGFGYTTDAFGVRGLFQTLSNVDGVKDASATTFGGEGKYNVNADYAVKAAYYMADPNTDADDDEYALFAAGVDRHFGKSQYLYLQYAMIMNGDASGASLGGVAHGNVIAPSAVGESPTGISFGMVKVW